MKKFRSRFAGCFVVACLALVASEVSAQSTGSQSTTRQQDAIDLNTLTPAVRPSDGFAITKADDLGHLGFSLNAILNYGYKPLTVRMESTKGGKTDVKSIYLVKHQLMGNLGLSFGLWNRISVDALAPVQLWNAGDDKESGYKKPSGKVSLGDVQAGIRARLYGENDDIFAIGLYAGAVLPTAYWLDKEQSYYGSKNVKGRASILAAVRPLDGLSIDLNVGGIFGKDGEKISTRGSDFITLDQQIDLGLGVSYAFLDDRSLSVHAEAIGSFRSLKDFASRSTSVAEGLLGMKYHAPFGLTVGLAGGGSFGTNGIGSPVARALFTLGWSNTGDGDNDDDGIPNSVDQCPDQPEDFDGFQDEDGCPDLDNDGDGIPDVDDKCPNEPGPADNDGCPVLDRDGDGVPDDIDQCPDEPGLADNNGCPILDQDGDGIPDDVDKCPTEPEDFDGFQDEDGCPDPDNDGDGIPDAVDKCPNEPGPASNEGCPIKDRDGDGIPDHLDKCPDEPETYNGIDDEDGCPDGKATVQVTEKEVKISETIYFDTGKSSIKKQSFQLLDTVASVLNRYDQITKLRVGGHTDDVGRDDKNLQLSKDRAKAVREYLVSKGVNASRLESEGYGETRPLCKDIPELTKTRKLQRRNRKKIKECRADNRRVEFRVIELNNKPVEASEEITVEVKE